jgi:hypothetical protein
MPLRGEATLKCWELSLPFLHFPGKALGEGLHRQQAYCVYWRSVFGNMLHVGSPCRPFWAVCYPHPKLLRLSLCSLTSRGHSSPWEAGLEAQGLGSAPAWGTEDGPIWARATVRPSLKRANPAHTDRHSGQVAETSHEVAQPLPKAVLMGLKQALEGQVSTCLTWALKSCLGLSFLSVELSGGQLAHKMPDTAHSSKL